MNAGEMLRRLRHFVQRDRVTRELEEEMRLHVAMRADVAGMHDLFSHAAAYGVGEINLSGNDEPLRLKIGVVTLDFFATPSIQTAIEVCKNCY